MNRFCLNLSCLFLLIFSLIACGGKAMFTDQEQASFKKDADANPKGPTSVSKDPGPTTDPKDPVETKSITKTFTAAPLMSSTVSFSQDYVLVDHQLEREKTEMGESKNITQNDRPQANKKFTQGTSGKETSEEFKQNALGILDIIVVVDNSGSMKQEQEKIANKLPNLISKVSNSNWQIRLVTTDVADPCNRFPILNKNSNNKNPTAEFGTNVLSLGIKGSYNEMGVQTAYNGINCQIDPWIRDGSKLAVLIVSDEDNCHSCSNVLENQPEALKALMTSKITNGNTKRKLGKDVRVYGIFRKPNTECSAAYTAHIYDKLVTDTSGYSGSICDSNYDATFAQISSDMENLLNPNFKLSHTPDLSTISVLVNNAPYSINTDFVVNGDTLEFTGSIPPANANIKVSYRYGQVPKFREFDIGESVGIVEKLTKTLPGETAKEVPAADYSLQGSKIVFNKNTMPEDDAIIKVHYRQALPALVKDFSVPENAVAGSFSALVNDSPAEFTYHPESNTISFANPPEDAASIKISYKISIVGDPLTSFPAPKQDNISDVMAWDIESLDKVGITYADGHFQIKPDDFIDGRKIKIKFRAKSTEGSLVYELPNTPLAENLNVVLSSEKEEKNCAAKDITIEDKRLKLACDLPDLNEVVIDYSYLLPGEQRFKLDLENPENTVWTVEVNDLIKVDYAKDGDTLILKDLPADAKISVLIEEKQEANFDNQ